MMEASRFVDMVVWNFTPCHVAPVEEMSFSDCVKRCLRIFFVKDTSKEVLQKSFLRSLEKELLGPVMVFSLYIKTE